MVKLVIITASQLLPREIDFFCLDDLTSKFDLEYWDCSAFLFPAFRVPDKVVSKDYLRVVPSLSALKQSLVALPSDAVVVEDVFANKSNFHFHKILNKYFHSHLTVFFSTNAVSVDCNKEKSDKPLIGSNKIKAIQRIKECLYRPFIIKRIVTFIRFHNSPMYEAKVNHLYNVRTHHLSDFTIIASHCGFKWRINHPDYERYCRMNVVDSSPIREPYIVFIDEYFPYLSEVVLDNPNLDIESTAVLYYKSMNKFFAVIEQKYNCPVIIAAHPRADYSKSNPFEGRTIMYYRTIELIKFSRACIIHNSNCYSYVVLYNKPVAAVINEALRRSELFTKYITTVNSSLNVEVQDIDSPFNDNNEIFSCIDETMRKQYIYTYLHDAKEDLHNAELFAKYYNEYHSNKILRKDSV